MVDLVTIKQVKVKLGNLCKQKRKAHKMTQEELAQALDLSRFTIQNFENGKNPTLDTALKIANHFDLLDTVYHSLQKYEESNDIGSLY
jgi:DNA-binding XRE family transcriptional regulator